MNFLEKFTPIRGGSPTSPEAKSGSRQRGDHHHMSGLIGQGGPEVAPWAINLSLKGVIELDILPTPDELWSLLAGCFGGKILTFIAQ